MEWSARRYWLSCAPLGAPKGAGAAQSEQKPAQGAGFGSRLSSKKALPEAYIKDCT